ncbi:MAG: hypothetical protein M1834_005356 [Cirrosporium novae-zelandiae]|nr:MAG: hypothetical protein M1834_005356 [Cirrosporium novae-zelandiae]
MAGRRPPSEREMVYCHACTNEWYRDEHGLECPECRSDIVEIIDEDDSPFAPAPPRHPLQDHNPWSREQTDTGSPGGAVFQIHESRGPGAMHFTRMTYRSGGGHDPPRAGSPDNDGTAQLYREFNTMLSGIMGGPLGAPRQGAQGEPPRPPPRIVYTGGELHPRDANNPQPEVEPFTDLNGIFGALFRGMAPPEQDNRDTRGNNFPNSPFDLFARLLNPQNIPHGDVVFTQEALDRVISDLMEQHNGSNAPGPASENAIVSLPEKPVEKSMLGDDGNADCSICMDAVHVGTMVAELPCKHWFHKDCVAAWLREHDTCPQCRAGITPKTPEHTQNQEGGSPRSPENPRNRQENPFYLFSTPPPPGGFPWPLNFSSPNGGRSTGLPSGPRIPGGWQEPPPGRNDHSASQSSNHHESPSDRRNSHSEPIMPQPPFRTHPNTDRGSRRRRRSTDSTGDDRRENYRGNNDQQGWNGGGVSGWFRTHFGNGSGGSGGN